jgi:hypothetical protein
VESFALEEDCPKVYVLLIHRYQLESHGVGAVVQLGAEAQPIFRSDRYYHADHRALAERRAPRLLSLSSRQFYLPAAVYCEKGPEHQVWRFAALGAVS